MTAVAVSGRTEVRDARVTRLLPVAAGAVGVVGLLVAGGVPVGASRHAHAAHAGTSTDLAAVAMAFAMMAPLAVPMCIDVGRASLWWRRTSAVAAALGSFLVVWALTAVVLHRAAAMITGRVAGGIVVAAVAASCVARQHSARHRRWIASCHQTRPLRPRRLARDAAAWGTVAGGRCVRACALPMLLTAAVSGWLVLVAVTGVLAVERHYEPLPRRRVAWAYAVVGAVLVVCALSGGGAAGPHGGHGVHA